jgi:predicted transcriptional regulator of viral defense system
MMKETREEKLLECASLQAGYFTAKQAERAGYSYRLHAYHADTGRWQKIERGVFRLRNFPVAQRDDLIRWSLWSRNRKDEPQFVVSHETALAIHELGDVMPAKLHFSVPPGFRKKVPKNIVLHKTKGLNPRDIEAREGFSVTSPLRTLMDAAESDLDENELAKALRGAMDQGLVRLQQIHVAEMSENGKLRMLMAIKAVEEKRS